MSERQQLERILDQPNARKMLDLIANGEGVKYGYNTLFGNQRFDSLQTHPNVRKEFTQTDGKKNYTTAAGRYQFLNSTWQELAKRYGLKDFSPRNQDIAALALMAQKGAIKNVVNGDFKGAVSKLGSTWASLPSSPYAQPKKTYAQLGLSGGSSQPKGLTLDFVDLTTLGYKAKNTQTAQPDFVDLRKLGYQDVPQQSNQPDFVDLTALGYKGT